MTPRLLALSLAPLLAAGSALAQAPGEVPTAAPPPPPYAQPAPPSWQAPPAPVVEVPVMAHRWGIGVSLGGLAVAPAGSPDGNTGSVADEAQFRVGELALRYRASRRVELELAMAGGRQVLENDTDGDLATGTVSFALRYRFRPERRWNWFVMGGLGGTIIAPHQSTAEERDGATRPLGLVGVGVERRFRHLALQAELRMVATGQRQDAMDPKIGPVQPVTGGSAAATADQLSGGMFTLGASYYF